MSADVTISTRIFRADRLARPEQVSEHTFRLNDQETSEGWLATIEFTGVNAPAAERQLAKVVLGPNGGAPRYYANDGSELRLAERASAARVSGEAQEMMAALGIVSHSVSTLPGIPVARRKRPTLIFEPNTADRIRAGLRGLYGPPTLLTDKVEEWQTVAGDTVRRVRLDREIGAVAEVSTEVGGRSVHVISFHFERTPQGSWIRVGQTSRQLRQVKGIAFELESTLRLSNVLLTE